MTYWRHFWKNSKHESGSWIKEYLSNTPLSDATAEDIVHGGMILSAGLFACKKST